MNATATAPAPNGRRPASSAATLAPAPPAQTPPATAEAASGRPYWQTGPCPPWCVEAHRPDHRDSDRDHSSINHGVELTTETPSVDIGAGAERKVSVYPASIIVALEQGYREAEPRITGTHQTGDDMHVCNDMGTDSPIGFTLDEAERFARVLLELVERGRKTA